MAMLSGRHLTFRPLGTHKRVGRFHDGRWRDVVFMERRSRITGSD